MQKSSRDKVLFLSSWYPNRILPKNGNFVQRHAQAVAGTCDVVALHVISDAQVTDFEISASQLEEVTEVIVYYPKSANWRPYKKYRMYLEAHRRGYAWIQKNWGQVDITHLNVIYPAGLFATELKKEEGIPYLLTEHWTAFLETASHRISSLEKHIVRKIGNEASMICPVSEDLQRAMLAFGIRDTSYSVIPNVVDTNLFGEKIKLPSEKIKIIHVSNFKDEQKNISGLLRVIAKLQSQRTDFELMMIGNLYGDQYTAQIKTLGIDPERLTILPEIALEKVAHHMRSSDIFLLFSNYENLPCVIAEAHCIGLAVVATDVGGISEMIDPSNGVIVAPGDEEALLVELQKIMDRPDTYDASSIRSKAIRRYSYEHVAQSYTEIYHTILASQK